MNVIIAHRMSLEDLSIPGVPAFNPMMLLHGEESLEVFAAIEPDSILVAQDELIDLQDKGKATIVVIQTTIKNKEDGALVAKITTNLFVRGIGGFGFKGTIKQVYPAAPKRSPDFSAVEKTKPDQAFLYRLNGDMNPLHVDPQMSEMGGFKVPILHGLCSFGITARAVYERYHKEDPMLLKKISGRFTSHVFPGETLVVDMWREGDLVVFATKTQERGIVVLKGYCELKPGAKM
jgi:acyl dehydratase